MDCTHDGKYLLMVANSEEDLLEGERSLILLNFEKNLEIVDFWFLQNLENEFYPKLEKIEFRGDGDVFALELFDKVLVFEVRNGKIWKVQEILKEEKCKGIF